MAKSGPKYRQGKAPKSKISTSGTTLRLPGRKPQGGNKGARNR